MKTNMEKIQALIHHDLVTPDGKIIRISSVDEKTKDAVVEIEGISPNFAGFHIDKDRVFFNIKSTLAQVGVDGIGIEYHLDPKNKTATVKVQLQAIGAIGIEMLKYVQVGSWVGKLFAADERRRVRNPDYLSRMFGRYDRSGRPLLLLGGKTDGSDLILDKVDGRLIAYLALQKGSLIYNSSIHGFLPTIGKALITNDPMRKLLKLHQIWNTSKPHNINENELLLVKTTPLHVRTVFGHVVNDLLSKGYKHTTASILQPDTTASGDVYELYGESKREITDIPLEFYTLDPYKEHVFFADRDQLKASLEDKEAIFQAFRTAPPPRESRAAVFIVKGTQLLHLKPDDWILSEPKVHEFPGLAQGEKQAELIGRYVEQQPSYPFLKYIEEDRITSQGVLFTRYFPSPLMKRMLLSDHVQHNLKGLYFENPSHSYGDYFSAEDRSLLHDMHKFAIPVFWVDKRTHSILQYIQKPGRDSGLFVPIDKIGTFLKSTIFGVYGSNLLKGVFEDEMLKLMSGILDLREQVSHPLLNKDTPIALVTGGGPGCMEVGNRIAKDLGILSCANILDFRQTGESVVNEQKVNPFIEAKMTYRLDKLVERQAEFNLDFPIFLTGGVGTDFEYALEEVRRKVGAVAATPVLLFGAREYWKQKITPRFQSNLKNRTVEGSEWLSNCFYCVENAKQGLKVYRQYFLGTLPIGKNGPMYEDGFVIVD